ncbi:MAG: hypothetical protein AABM31_03110 [Actinomycetota bacterium]
MTDYGQAVVWRVPPGGGPAQVWLSDTRLDGGEFGTTGIALAADRRTLLVAQGSSAGLGALNPTTGKIYSVPIGADGPPGAVTQLWESRPGDLPDGFGIARSGRLYVPLVGLPQQIAVVSPQGQEIERFPEQPGGENGSAVPFDGPSSARFLGTRLIVANQSPVAGDPAHQALLDVEAGEPGLTELIPGLDRTPPVISRVSLSRRTLGVRRRRAARKPGTRIRLRLSEPATVTVRVAAPPDGVPARGRLHPPAARGAALDRLPRQAGPGPRAGGPAPRTLPLRAASPRRVRQRLGPRVPPLPRGALTGQTSRASILCAPLPSARSA